MSNTSVKKDTTLTAMQLAIMTTIAVASLRSLPAMASEGWASIVMYLVPAAVFLIPTALVSAELGTTYKGGVFVWVKEAFGERFGFVAVWLQWIQNVVWFPIQLSFIAAAVAFMIGRGDLAESGIFTGVIIISFYWAATILALRGGNLFAKVSSVGGLIGTLIPAAVLILLGAVWLGTSEPVANTLTESSVMPKITGIGSFVLLVSNVLTYAGMEMNAVHAGELKNPRKDFTKSVVIAFGLILGVFILPTLTISASVPMEKLGMTNGIMVAFQTIFETWNLGWLGNVFAAAIMFGAVAAIVTWVAGPSRGLLEAAKRGLLPVALQKQNQHGVQSGILIPQAVIVTALAFIYVFAPNVGDIFIALTGMAAALYVLMYIMMFAAALHLRHTEPNADRGYKTPAMGLVAGVGIIGCALAFVMSFFPTEGEAAIPPHIYPLVVAAVVFVLGIPPFLFYAARKPSWDLRSDQEKEIDHRHGDFEEDPILGH